MAGSATASAGERVGVLFEEHARMVFALCRMVLRGREEAEDATQQTFLLAHRSLLAGVVPERPDAWLATIARNECYRRLGRRPPDALPLLDSDEGGADPSQLVDQREEIEALCRALAELPPAQRQAVVLREFYGLSYREVAAVLGVSGPAVESLLFKSRRRLQDRLRPVRAASSVLILPLTVRDSLAATIPGFPGAATGGAGAAAGGALLAKIGAAPLAAKVAAAVVAAGAGTGVTIAELRQRPDARPAEPAVELRAGDAARLPDGPVRRAAPPGREEPPGLVVAVSSREDEEGREEVAEEREERGKRDRATSGREPERDDDERDEDEHEDDEGETEEPDEPDDAEPEPDDETDDD